MNGPKREEDGCCDAKRPMNESSSFRKDLCRGGSDRGGISTDQAKRTVPEEVPQPTSYYLTKQTANKNIMTLFTKSSAVLLSLVLLLSSGGSDAFTPAANPFGVTPTQTAFRTTTRSLSTPLRVVSSPDQEQQAANNEIEKLRSMAAKLRAEAASLEAEKTDEMAQAAQKAFQTFDTNQDGEITIEELKAGLEKTFKMIVPEARLQKLMEIFDSSGDGALQLEEFLYCFPAVRVRKRLLAGEGFYSQRMSERRFPQSKKLSKI
jgi:hypothetical protein